MTYRDPVRLPDIDDLVVTATRGSSPEELRYHGIIARVKENPDIILDLVPQDYEPPFYLLHWYSDFDASKAKVEIARFGQERVGAEYVVWSSNRKQHDDETIGTEKFVSMSTDGVSAMRVYTESDDGSGLLWRLTDDFDRKHDTTYPAKFAAFMAGTTPPQDVQSYIERTRTSEHPVDLDRLLASFSTVYATYVDLVKMY